MNDIQDTREARGELTYAEIQKFTDAEVKAYWERLFTRQESEAIQPRTQTCPKCKKEISSH